MAKQVAVLVLTLWLLQGTRCYRSTVSLPENIEALDGSCVFIPCSFEPKKGLGDDQIGVWIVNDPWKGNEVFRKDTSYGVWENISVTIGDVEVRNCSTWLDRVGLQQEGAYYFRTEGKLKYTFTASHVNIQVRDKPLITPIVPVKEGTATSLTCSAPSACPSDPPVLTWSDTLNGIEFEESSKANGIKVESAVLHFNASHLHHDKTVTCTASSRGQHWNNTVTLNVTYGPKNTHMLYNPVKWTLGILANLTCNSNANPPSHYTWYQVKKSVVTSRGTGQTLTVNVVTPSDNGVYYCNAENEHGAANSSAVTIDVQYSPRNTSIAGRSVTGVPEGGAVTLSCSSNANPPSSYSWYHVSKSSATKRGSREKLTIKSVTLSDGGLYYCEAKNEHGMERSMEVTVDVQYSPRNTSVRGHRLHSIPEGGAVTLSCTSDANPPSRYTWYHRSKSSVVQRGLEQNLNLRNVSLNDAENYYCEARNRHGGENATAVTLDVQYSPKNTSIKGHRVHTIRKGGAVTLSCSSNANPPSSYTWYQVGNSSVSRRGSEQNLTIQYVTVSDGGLYYCEAKNKHGAGNTTTVVLVVKTQPSPSSFVSILTGCLFLIFIFLLLLLLCCCKKRMKTVEFNNEDSDMRPAETTFRADVSPMVQESTNGKMNSTEESAM
ncbi:B-cell receptor CD22-like [Polypterus senegalus]|uniref:B-cell receptor CD22-like n=1 Tax=Polypterus senegalus TaxID=55291 RepID=UPI001965C8C9|nr:B-cell receptor CD22-like [Polypterus senegalus]